MPVFNYQMSRQYTQDSKISFPSQKRQGRSILSQFQLETETPKLRFSPKCQLMTISPNLICYQKLPVTSESRNKKKYQDQTSPHVPVQTNKKVNSRYASDLNQGYLNELICQKDGKIKKYRCQINIKNYQLGQINAMFQNYVALNKTLLNQCKQKINYFEDQVNNFSHHSMIQQLKEKYNSELTLKNQTIARLQSQVKAQQDNIYKLNLRIKDSVDKQPSLSTLIPKLAKLNKKVNQISFGDYNAKQQKKREENLNKSIIDLKQYNKKIVEELEERIAQKQETIRKMAQFNTDICLLFLKERQSASFYSLKAAKAVKDISTSIEQPSSMQRQPSSKDSDLFRAKSQKQIDNIMENYEMKILCLQQESSYLKKQYIQIQRENELIKQYLDLANQKIKKLQLRLSQKEKNIEELLEKEIRKSNQQKHEFMLFVSDCKQGMLNSDVISSVDQPLNDDKSKIGNSQHSQQTIKRELIQGMKQFSIQQISEVSFQLNRTQKILKSPKNPAQGFYSAKNSNKNSSQQQDYFCQENKITKNSAKGQLMQIKYQVQKSKVTALQQSLNIQRQLNRIMRAKIKSMQGQSTDSKITDKSFKAQTGSHNRLNSPTNKQSMRQIKQALCNILMIIEKKEQNHNNYSLQSNRNQKDNVVDLKKEIKYRLNKVAQLHTEPRSKTAPLVQTLNRVKSRTRYFASPKKIFSINAADTVNSITLNSP